MQIRPIIFLALLGCVKESPAAPGDDGPNPSAAGKNLSPVGRALAEHQARIKSLRESGRRTLSGMGQRAKASVTVKEFQEVKAKFDEPATEDQKAFCEALCYKSAWRQIQVKHFLACEYTLLTDADKILAAGDPQAIVGKVDCATYIPGKGRPPMGPAPRRLAETTLGAHHASDAQG